MLNAQQRREFGAYMKSLRDRTKKSLRKVNEETGISAGYLGLVENGERNPPQPDFLRKLAVCYGVPQIELMRRAGHLADEPDASASDEEAELRHAYEFVINHPRYRAGHSLDRDPSPEVMRFVVEMYEQFSGNRLLDGPRGETPAEGD